MNIETVIALGIPVLLVGLTLLTTWWESRPKRDEGLTDEAMREKYAK